MEIKNQQEPIALPRVKFYPGRRTEYFEVLLILFYESRNKKIKIQRLINLATEKDISEQIAIYLHKIKYVRIKYFYFNNSIHINKFNELSLCSNNLNYFEARNVITSEIATGMISTSCVYDLEKRVRKYDQRINSAWRLKFKVHIVYFVYLY